MIHYVARLRDCEGNIIDGEIYYDVKNNEHALIKYLARCERLGIVIGKYDYITVDIIDI